MVLSLTAPFCPSPTPLPENLAFLDNRYFQVAAVVGGIGLVCLVAAPLLIGVRSAVFEAFSLVNKSITYLAYPVLRYAFNLPDLAQIALSVAILAGGSFASAAFKGGLQSRSSFFGFKNWRDLSEWRDKIVLFGGLSFLTMPFRQRFPYCPLKEQPILGRTLITPLANSIIFDLVLANAGRAITSCISSLKVRAVAERVQTIGLSILYGVFCFARAPSSQLFIGALQGVYALCINSPAALQYGFEGSFAAQVANNTFMSFVYYVFRAIF